MPAHICRRPLPAPSTQLREEEAQASFGPRGIPSATGPPFVVYWMSGPLPGSTTFNRPADWHSPGTRLARRYLPWQRCQPRPRSALGHLPVTCCPRSGTAGSPDRPDVSCV